MCGEAGGIVVQKYPTAEAAWQAAWKEGKRLVQMYQAELTQGSWESGNWVAEAHANAPASIDAAGPSEKKETPAGMLFCFSYSRKRSTIAESAQPLGLLKQKMIRPSRQNLGAVYIYIYIVLVFL